MAKHVVARMVVAAAALLAVSPAANAQSEFVFAYNGTTTTFCTPAGPLPCPGFPPPPEGGPLVAPWTGTISFSTGSSADGAYSCRTCGRDGELSIVFDGISWGSSWFPPFSQFPPQPLTLTLLGGAFSLGGSFTQGPFSAVYNGGYGSGEGMLFLHGVFDGAPRIEQFGNATLTLIPEPETWALMLAGVAAIGAVTRRRRSIVRDLIEE